MNHSYIQGPLKNGFTASQNLFRKEYEMLKYVEVNNLV
jgi:hypothetical protein